MIDKSNYTSLNDQLNEDHRQSRLQEAEDERLIRDLRQKQPNKLLMIVRTIGQMLVTTR